LATKLGIPLAIAHKIIQELIAESRVTGTLQVRKDKSLIYIPEISSHARQTYVTSHFKQNGYIGKSFKRTHLSTTNSFLQLDFATLDKFGMLDIRSSTSKLFEGTGVALRTCYVAKDVIEVVDETIATHTLAGQITDVTVRLFKCLC